MTNAVVRLEALEAGPQYSLDAFPVDRFNRLVPTQTIQMPSDLLVPVIQVVQLDPADRDGKSPDHYSSRDVPAGHRALTARGLSKVSDAAGVSFYDERRTDDGSDPNVIGVTVMAEVIGPTGQRRRATGSQVIDLRTWFSSNTSPAEQAKFRKQFYAHVATRARNRAVRGLLSLRASYPDSDIAKPFAAVTFAPNMKDPDIRAAMVQALTGGVAAAFGPATSPAAVANPAIAAGVIEDVGEVEDDEDLAASAYAQEQLAAGRATADGEVLGDEPDWALDPEPAQEAEVVTRLRAASEAKPKQSGPPSAAQKASLGEAFAGLGTAQLRPVFRAAFGREGHDVDGRWRFDDLQARDVLAILEVSEAMGLQAFQVAIAAVSA